MQERLTDINKRTIHTYFNVYDLIKLKLPSKKSIDNNTTRIEIGGNLTYDDLIEYFNTINYDRVKYVDSPGDFAVRGSIIDFWSYSEKQPCRLEYDGDFLESIRHFDFETQRSLDKITSVTVAASILTEEENASDIFDYLDNPLVIAADYELQNLFTEKT